MRLLTLVLVASLVVVAEPARAQEGATVRLDFASEGQGCPDVGAFADEVSARIGRVGIDEASAQVAVVRIAIASTEALVTAEFGGNTRVFRDADCRVAAEAAAAAIAVWLDEPAQVAILGAANGEALGAMLAGEEDVANEGARPSQATTGGVLLRVTTSLTTREPDEDFSFHIETNTGRGSGGSAHYFDRLCLMPCETRIRPGVHQFGISRSNLAASALEELTEVEVDSELHIDVRRASGVNIAGRWLVFATIFGGLPMTIAAILKRDDWGKGVMWGVIGASAGVVLGATLMLSLSDGGGTEVTVRPL